MAAILDADSSYISFEPSSLYIADLFVLVAPVKGRSQLALVALCGRSVLSFVAGASICS